MQGMMQSQCCVKKKKGSFLRLFRHAQIERRKKQKQPIDYGRDTMVLSRTYLSDILTHHTFSRCFSYSFFFLLLPSIIIFLCLCVCMCCFPSVFYSHFCSTTV